MKNIVSCIKQPKSNLKLCEQNMAVTGYQRIQQLNQFYPENVQKAFKTKIGKNEMVIVSDFLLGDDYTKIENPHLPTGLLDELRNHRGMTREKWIKNVRMMIKYIKVNDGMPDQIDDMSYLLRYLTIYPLVMDNLNFINTVVKRCDILYNIEIPKFINTNHMVAPLPHFHFTRKNKEKKIISDNYMRSISGCLRIIDECEHTYKTALHNHNL